MGSFTKCYFAEAQSKRSVLCVGLDPTFNHVPMSFGKDLPGMEKYLKAVIDVAAEKVAVVKPQYAYYGALGPYFVDMMVRIIDHAHLRGLQVILDAKRGDIGETMEQYGNEVFGVYGVDACTFIPYLGPTFMPAKGTESWMPWLAKGRMVITMVRTSNPEAAWLQDQKLENGLFVYEFLAESAKQWNDEVCHRTGDRGQVGGVVGATWPEQATSCRQHAGDDVFFLIPGYGAQGGGAEGAVEGLVNGRGELMGTVNSSRGITLDSWFDRKLGKPRKGDPLELIAAAIDAANADLNQALVNKLGRDPYVFAA